MASLFGTEIDMLIIEALINAIFSFFLLAIGGVITYLVVHRYQREKEKKELKKEIVADFSNVYEAISRLAAFFFREDSDDLDRDSEFWKTRVEYSYARIIFLAKLVIHYNTKGTKMGMAATNLDKSLQQTRDLFDTATNEEEIIKQLKETEERVEDMLNLLISDEIKV